MAPPNGGASQLTNGSLMLDLMALMTSSSLQPVTTRQDGTPPVLHALPDGWPRQRLPTIGSLRVTIVPTATAPVISDTKRQR
jgi:hypothetical protein